MATFNINCPHCGGTLEVQDEWGGMAVNCPFCGKSLVVPRRESGPAQPGMPVPAAAPNCQCGMPHGTAGGAKKSKHTLIIALCCGCGGALILILVAVFAAFMLSNKGGASGKERPKTALEGELAFLASRGHAAGEYLKKVAPGKKILIIAEPNFDKSAQVTHMVDMIKKAYGSQDVTIAAIPVPASTEDNPQPIEEVMKAKDFDKLTDQYKDAGIIISLIGLPSNARAMKAFAANPAPKFFLLSTGIGTGKFVQDQMNKGVIVGAVVPNPKANYDLKAPSDPAKAFAIRFVLVTKENLAANKQFFE